MKPIFLSLLTGATFALSAQEEATDPASAGPSTDKVQTASAKTTKPIQEFDSYTVAASSINVSPQETDSSLSIFTEKELLDPNNSHLEGLVLDTPNLTFAGGSSRARFFQIRGIGEYDNFVEPVTPSVGLVIDGIDFSGFGNIVSLFDVERVEVLRGPQSGLYGTQALAGLIYIESTNPTDYWTGLVEGTIAEYDTYRGGVAVGGPLDFLSDDLTMRLSVYQNNTDGATYNEFLGRNAGSDQDEFTSRLKVNWTPSDNFRLKVTGLYSDFQNGYDNFSLTANKGSRTVYSDMPGEDNQRSKAFAVEAGFGPLEQEWISRTTFQDTDTQYSFDADWLNTSDDPLNLDLWQNVWGEPSPQIWYESYDRNAQRIRQDFLYRRDEGPDSTRYTVGVGGSYLDQDTNGFTNYPTDAFGPFSNTLYNTYEEGQIYTFGEILYPLGEKHRVGGTLRVEGRNVELKDSGNPQFVGSADDQEVLWGGDISYNYLLADAQAVYIKLARGYKGGGINADRNAGQLYYDAESLYEIESGWNYVRPDGGLESQISVFAFTRDNPQVRRWEIDPGFNYVLTQTNAESSYGYGLEGSTSWMAQEWLEIGGSLGLLQSKIDADNIPTLDGGRDQAMAPGYTFSVYGEVRPIPEAFLRLKVRGQDSVYYDTFHNGKSDAYQLVDLWAGYTIGGFEINFWVTNLFDTDYGTRSIYFGDYNDPTFVPELQFEELGDPRQVGVTVRYFF